MALIEWNETTAVHYFNDDGGEKLYHNDKATYIQQHEQLLIDFRYPYATIICLN